MDNSGDFTFSVKLKRWSSLVHLLSSCLRSYVFCFAVPVCNVLLTVIKPCKGLVSRLSGLFTFPNFFFFYHEDTPLAGIIPLCHQLLLCKVLNTHVVVPLTGTISSWLTGSIQNSHLCLMYGAWITHLFCEVKQMELIAPPSLIMLNCLEVRIYFWQIVWSLLHNTSWQAVLSDNNSRYLLFHISRLQCQCVHISVRWNDSFAHPTPVFCRE